MGILDRLLGGRGGSDDTVQLYTCNDCSNIFTKTWKGGPPGGAVTCPNCGSTDVELTVDSS